MPSAGLRRRVWSETSYRLQALRYDPECAGEDFARLLDIEDPGLHARLAFEPTPAAPAVLAGSRPRVAIRASRA